MPKRQKTAGEAKRAKQRKAGKRSERTSAIEEIPFEEWDDVVSKGYAVESFPITKEDVAHGIDRARRIAKESGFSANEVFDKGWFSAYVAAHSVSRRMIGGLDYHRGSLVHSGVIVGYDQLLALEEIGAALEAHETADLYAAPLDTEERDVFHPDGKLLWRTSDRRQADEWLSVPVAMAFEDLVWPLIEFAVAAARDAAAIVGRDVAAQTDGPRSRLRPGGVTLRRPTVEERAELMRECGKGLRRILRAALRDPEIQERVGRNAETARDHQAYCLREWLMNSTKSDLAQMPTRDRQRAAKQRVLDNILGNVTDSSWTRIMANGRKAHAHVAPETPYCDASRDLGLPFLLHRK